MVYLPYQIFNHDKEKTQNLHPEYWGQEEKAEVEGIYPGCIHRIIIPKFSFLRIFHAYVDQ